jgi:hypothetical protein
MRLYPKLGAFFNFQTAEKLRFTSLMPPCRIFSGAAILLAIGVSAHGQSAGAAPITPAAALPYTTGFETGDGFHAGPLNGQNGWTADREVSVQDHLTKFGGPVIWLVWLSYTIPPQRAKISFASYPKKPQAYLSFFTKAAAGASVEAGSQYWTDAAKVAIVRSSEVGRIYAFDGDGTGGGTWRAVGSPLPIDEGNQTISWFELEILEDFHAKTWSLFLNGTRVAKDLGLSDRTVNSLGYFGISSGTERQTLLSGFSAGFKRGKFPDYGKQLIPPIAPPANLAASGVTDVAVTISWSPSKSHNHRAGYKVGYSVSRDGFLIGSTIQTSFTDSKVGENTNYSYAVRAIDEVGNISDLSQSITVHTKPTLDAANGLPQDWELRYYSKTGLDPNAPSGNGDGYTIRQEYELGRDPTDFYNGVIPIHKPLYGGGPGPDDQLAMIVLHPDGTPWPNAPVTFNVTAGHRRISATRGGPIYQFTVEVRADAQGMAQVYLEPLTP